MRTATHPRSPPSRWWRAAPLLVVALSMPLGDGVAAAQVSPATVTVSPSTVVVGDSFNASATAPNGRFWIGSLLFQLIDSGGTVRSSRTVPSNNAVTVDTVLTVPVSAPAGSYRVLACGSTQSIVFSLGSSGFLLPAGTGDTVTAQAQTCGAASLSVVPISVTVSASDVLVGSPVNAIVTSNRSAGVRANVVGPGYTSPTQTSQVSAGSSTSFSFATAGLSAGNYTVQACLITGSNSCTPGAYAASIVINCVPQVTNQSASTLQGQPVSFALGSVLGPGCAPLAPSMEIVAQPANGSATADASGARYTPASGFSGTDSFAVRVCVSRPQACSRNATLTVNVNASPVASNTSLAVVSNGTVAFDVRDFSSDADGSVVGWSTSQLPSFGTLSNSGGATGTFSAPAGRCGESTTFIFVVIDDDGAQSNSATATISVIGCPSARAFTVDGVAGQSVPFRVAGSDPDGRLVDWELVSSPGLGSVRDAGGLDGTYSAPEESCGEQTSFQFRVIDDDGSVSGAATASVVIVGCPTLRPDVVEDGDGGFVAIDVLANDEFPGGADPESVSVVSEPTGGTVAVVEGRIEYTADPDFLGEDEFTYEACDQFGQCGTALAAVEVSFECEPIEEGIVTIEPATANAGDLVNVMVVVPATGIDSRCETLTVSLTLDGAAWGPPLLLERTGATAAGVRGFGTIQMAAQVQPDAFVGQTSLEVPIALVPGDYEVGMNEATTGRALGTGALSIPEVQVTTATTVSLAGEGEGDGGAVPGVVWGGLAGVAALAGGGAVWAAGRRRRRQLEDPCPGERERVEEATSEVDETRARHADAEARLQQAESTLAGLEAELASCTERSAGGAIPVMPLGGGRRDDDEVVITEHRLAEVSNPHAPVADDGVSGWWTPRTAPIDAVVLCDLAQVGIDGTATVDDLVARLASLDIPFAAHVLVTSSGPVGLLPQTVSISGLGRPSALVAVVSDASDPVVLAHAGRLVASWRRQHGLEEAAVTTGVVDGKRSAIDVSAVQAPSPERAARLVGAVPLGSGGPPVDPCADVRARVEAQRADVERIRAEATQARADVEAAEQRVEETSETLRECECRPVPVAGVPEEAAPEDDSAESKWFLLKHENPNAPLRANQKRGWYYPSRREPVSGIVVHTAEGASGPGTALYLSTVSRPASAHVIADATGIIKLLPDSFTAFHAAGGNGRGLGIEIEYFADEWGSSPIVEEALLRAASMWCGMKAAAYGIPAVRITAEQWAAGERGFVAHGDLDPSRRRDPGHAFPWDEFLRRVATFTGGSSPD